MSPLEAAPAKIRGSDAVRAALIEAAARMLGEVGPDRISVREVAARAGVNHGQVHHYFGGRRGLLEAAMRHLARGHFEHARALAGDAAVPPLLSLAEDVDYWRAICQVVMAGDLELARIEIDEEISVPGTALRMLEARHAPEARDPDFKARFAALVAQQLGWVAFEEFMLLLVDVPAEQRDDLRARVKRVMQEAVDRALAAGSAS